MDRRKNKRRDGTDIRVNEIHLLLLRKHAICQQGFVVGQVYKPTLCAMLDSSVRGKKWGAGWLLQVDRAKTHRIPRPKQDPIGEGPNENTYLRCFTVSVAGVFLGGRCAIQARVAAFV